MVAKDKDPWGGKALGQAMALATNMAAALLVGYFLGHYLDKFFNTSPWLTIIMFMLGMFTGLKMMYETAFGKMDKAEDVKKMFNLKENLSKLKDAQQTLREDQERLRREKWTEDQSRDNEDDLGPRS